MNTGKNIRIIATILSSLTLLVNTFLLVAFYLINITQTYSPSDAYSVSCFHREYLIWLMLPMLIITGAFLFLPVKPWLKRTSFGVIVFYLISTIIFVDWLSKG